MNSIFENDFHVHTHHSPCAKDKFNSQPLRMLACAERLGLKTIGFTDHFYQHPYQAAAPIFRDCGPAIIDQLRLELQENQTNVRVLVGCEADQVRLDTLSIKADYARQLDFVMVAASHFHTPNTQQPDNLEPRTVAEHYLAFLRQALEPEFVNVIAHPFYTPGHTLGEPEQYMAEMSDAELYEIAELSLQNKTAMDVNGHIDREPGYVRAIKRFFQICREVGVKFTFGSDAHHLNKLGKSEALVAAITFLELEPADFISADELISWT